MDDYKTYTIVKGDNLTKIARAFGTTVDELVKLNGIENPNLIYAGAELKIPFTAEELAAKAEEAAKAAAEAAKKEAEERMAAAAARLAEEKKAAEEAAAQAAAKVEETVEEVKDEATEKKGLFASLFKKKS